MLIMANNVSELHVKEYRKLIENQAQNLIQRNLPKNIARITKYLDQYELKRGVILLLNGSSSDSRCHLASNAQFLTPQKSKRNAKFANKISRSAHQSLTKRSKLKSDNIVP